MKPHVSHRVPLRGLDHRVLTWGDPGAPKLFLLHGWMDVAASFQFLVDALERDWHVIAPDLRGFGESDWQPQGYWFADYIADLEALLDRFAPGERATLVGHSLGGNVVMQYAGVRPQRVRALVSLDGFGIEASYAYTDSNIKIDDTPSGSVLPGNSLGSIPLPDTETVLRTLSAAVGRHIVRIPDGETGIRRTWIKFLQDVLADNPGI